MERFLGPDIIKQVKEVFEPLEHPVEILFFSSQANCELCDETIQLLNEVAEIAPDKIFVSAHDKDEEVELAQQYHIDKAPMFVIGAREDGKLVDYGIRFSGIPAGHEFSSLITTILDIGSPSTKLEKASIEFLEGLKEPVNLMVFVTPT
jgi:alkyl hydroperoxide reductase subunit AhpF